jgi:hypothetical protein
MHYIHIKRFFSRRLCASLVGCISGNDDEGELLQGEARKAECRESSMHIRMTAQRMFIQAILAWPAIILAKLAILLLYLRLFQIRAAMRYAIYAGVIWTILAYLPNMFLFTYICTARPGEPWDINVGLRCGNKQSLKWLVASAGMSVLLDLYILALPIPVVRKLNMSGRKRFGVLLIFFAAFL